MLDINYKMKELRKDLRFNALQFYYYRKFSNATALRVLWEKKLKLLPIAAIIKRSLFYKNCMNENN
jgi:hypothetical protein